MTYVKELERDTCLDTAEKPAIMRQCHQWRAIAGRGTMPHAYVILLPFHIFSELLLHLSSMDLLCVCY